MSKTRLEGLARELRYILFFDDLAEEWDPDKPWSADTLEEIGRLADRFGLRPAEPPDDLESG